MPVTPGARKLVLASASPRRLDLFRQVGLEPDAIAPADIDETPHARELPRDYARRMADAKAAGAPVESGCYLVACDTVVAVGRRILPKAATRGEAAGCLDLLSGRRHLVLGGLTVLAPDGRAARKLVRTQVAFKRLSADEIDAYLDSGEWDGKAGGYAIQGRAAAFARWMSGSYSNVVGLPLFETLQALKGLGYEP
jgi:septum formation protein